MSTVSERKPFFTTGDGNKFIRGAMDNIDVRSGYECTVIQRADVLDVVVAIIKEYSLLPDIISRFSRPVPDPPAARPVAEKADQVKRRNADFQELAQSIVRAAMRSDVSELLELVQFVKTTYPENMIEGLIDDIRIVRM